MEVADGGALEHVRWVQCLFWRWAVKYFNRRRVSALSIGALAIVVGLTVLAGAQGDRAAAKKWPPQFPRDGATKLFENEHVIVWEQVGRPKDAVQHKHIRDILNFGIEPGG